MTPQTAAQRKALERQRKRERGLSPLEVWARATDFERIKNYVKRITKESK